MDIRIFLAHAVKFELEAEEAYLKLVELMTARDNRDAAEFFREMAGYSRLHREVAMKRAGFDDSTDIHGLVDSWPDGITETPDITGINGTLDLDGAMSVALAAEKRGVAFYEGVSQITTDAQIRHLAEEFAAEEHEHVLALERFFGHKSY
jgi:rubrerythrin